MGGGRGLREGLADSAQLCAVGTGGEGWARVGRVCAASSPSPVQA